MSGEDDHSDVLSALGLVDSPTPKEGKIIAPPDVKGDIEATRGKIGRSAAEILGLPDAMRALRGQMTPDEASHFALTAAMGLLPGAKIENSLMRGASRLARPAENALGLGRDYIGASDISDEAIAKKLASDPGASIFDVAGTHVGGASSPYSPNPLTNSMLTQKGYGDPDAITIPRVGGVLSTPLAAKVLGRSENLVHGTRVSLDRWISPEGGGDALALPDDELGVHFGNPRQAQVFTGGGLDNYSSPRTYPVVMQANNPLRMRDLGSWHEDKITGELERLNKLPDTKGQFPQSELDELDGMPAIRKYLNDKGYDSVVYQNSEEDRDHDSFIKFTPSPVAPQFVSGVRSPFAKFDPNKLSWPELAAGIGGAGATELMFDEQNNPIVQTK